MAYRLLSIALLLCVAAEGSHAQEGRRGVRLSHTEAGPAAAKESPARRDGVALRYFDPDLDRQETWVVERVEPIDSGFVFGTNYFADRAKAVAFQIPDSLDEPRLTEVRVWFGYKRSALEDDTTSTYTLAFYNGTPATGPQGEPVRRDTFLLSGILADDILASAEGPTAHAINLSGADTLGLSVTPGSYVFVSVEFGEYGAEAFANASIVASDVLDERVAEVWEQWVDASWHNVSDAWFAPEGAQRGEQGWDVWIEAFVAGAIVVDTEPEPQAVRAVHLETPYPNPVRTQATVPFTLDRPGEVALRLYNALGREVRTLVTGLHSAGRHEVEVQAGNLPSGPYLLRLEAHGQTQHRAITLLR